MKTIEIIVPCYNESENIFLGLFRIITSPAILVTDFIKVGGIGAAFLNALLILSFNYFLVRLFKIKITGVVIAMFFTVFGFSFFGKNIRYKPQTDRQITVFDFKPVLGMWTRRISCLRSKGRWLM